MQMQMLHCLKGGPASETARKYAALLCALVWLSVVALAWTFLFL